jgi:hypothetical protein
MVIVVLVVRLLVMAVRLLLLVVTLLSVKLLRILSVLEGESQALTVETCCVDC